MNSRQIPGGAYVVETVNDELQIPGYEYIVETGGSTPADLSRYYYAT